MFESDKAEIQVTVFINYLQQFILYLINELERIGDKKLINENNITYYTKNLCNYFTSIISRFQTWYFAQ